MTRLSNIKYPQEDARIAQTRYIFLPGSETLTNRDTVTISSKKIRTFPLKGI